MEKSNTTKTTLVTITLKKGGKLHNDYSLRGCFGIYFLTVLGVITIVREK